MHSTNFENTVQYFINSMMHKHVRHKILENSAPHASQCTQRLEVPALLNVLCTKILELPRFLTNIQENATFHANANQCTKIQEIPIFLNAHSKKMLEFPPRLNMQNTKCWKEPISYHANNKIPLEVLGIWVRHQTSALPLDRKFLHH